MSHKARARNRIVVGVDGSPSAERALRWASDEAAVRRSDLEVVCCWPDQFANPWDARRVLDIAGRIARSRGYQLDIHLTVIQGAAGPALVALSEEAALLVVGRRGLGRCPVVGSVSAYCVEHAKCPVEVVPTARQLVPTG